MSEKEQKIIESLLDVIQGAIGDGTQCGELREAVDHYVVITDVILRKEAVKKGGE